MIIVRPAETLDVHPLAATLRAEDVAEVRAASGLRVSQAIRSGINAGRAWVACDKQGAFLVGGVVPTGKPGVGCPWMLATDRLLTHSRWVARHSRTWVEELHRDYPRLHNFVDARNHVHIKWLAWCGFEFIRIHPRYGAEQRPFFEFQRISNV
jgi:hypothetical protein